MLSCTLLPHVSMIVMRYSYFHCGLKHNSNVSLFQNCLFFSMKLDLQSLQMLRCAVVGRASHFQYSSQNTLNFMFYTCLCPSFIHIPTVSRFCFWHAVVEWVILFLIRKFGGTSKWHLYRYIFNCSRQTSDDLSVLLTYTW